MCGRYYNRRQKQQIAEHLRATTVFEEPLTPDYNIAPTTFQPVLRQARETGNRELVLMRWGLVPFFAKTIKSFRGFTTFNARAESLASSATFRRPFERRRCLVPADGFYEWKTLETGKRPVKQPFAISLRNGEPFSFAGLWDAWKEPDGRYLQSFSIITTEANEIMAPIHNRMPVHLAPRDWEEWLSRDEERTPPAHLLRPFDSAAMRIDCCNPAVGNVRNNGPEMLNSA